MTPIFTLFNARRLITDAVFKLCENAFTATTTPITRLCAAESCRVGVAGYDVDLGFLRRRHFDFSISTLPVDGDRRVPLRCPPPVTLPGVVASRRRKKKVIAPDEERREKWLALELSEFAY